MSDLEARIADLELTTSILLSLLAPQLDRLEASPESTPAERRAVTLVNVRAGKHRHRLDPTPEGATHA